MDKRILDIYDFGIGFIKVKLSLTTSLNVYLDEIDRFEDVELPHNHQHGFQSTILAGRLCETVYYTWESDEHDVVCACGDVGLMGKKKLSYNTESVHVMSTGTTYTRDAKTYHSVSAVDGTVTKVIKDISIPREDAYVIGMSSSKPEYQSKYTKEQLWDMAYPHIRDYI